MISNGCKLNIADNSDLLLGRCINTYNRPYAKVGDFITACVVKVKTKGQIQRVKKISKSKTQGLICIQTRKLYHRFDGSGLKFSNNAAVTVVKASKSKMQLGFKTITSCVPFETKKHHKPSFGLNLIKLAKSHI